MYLVEEATLGTETAVEPAELCRAHRPGRVRPVVLLLGDPAGGCGAEPATATTCHQPTPTARPTRSTARCRLPRRQREVLVLRYWAGLSEAEVADTLGVSRGTVKTCASRAPATARRPAGGGRRDGARGRRDRRRGRPARAKVRTTPRRRSARRPRR